MKSSSFRSSQALQAMAVGRCALWAVGGAHSNWSTSPAQSKLSRRAGADVARAEVARDGKIVLVLQKDDEPPSMSERNEWDEVNGED